MSNSHFTEPVSTLPGLIQWCADNGYSLEDVDANEAALTDRQSGGIWSLFRVEGWIQVKGLVFEDVDATQALCLSLARLHARLLGCRYGIDEVDNLWLYADLFPHDQTATAIGEVIVQMQAIVDSTYDLIARVQQSDIAADDAAIDEAFQLQGDGPLH